MFSAEAEGSPAPSYQWQVNYIDGMGWQDIEGANTGELTVENLTKAQNGIMYRCVVTNTLGSATSNELTLTVETGASCSVAVAKNCDGGELYGGGSYTAGSKATVAAALKEGYRFDGWYEGGAVKSQSAVYSFRVTLSTTLTARFTAVSAAPPVFTEHPDSILLTSGAPFSLSVQATGYTKLTWQRLTRQPIGMSHEWMDIPDTNSSRATRQF